MSSARLDEGVVAQPKRDHSIAQLIRTRRIDMDVRLRLDVQNQRDATARRDLGVRLTRRDRQMRCLAACARYWIGLDTQAQHEARRGVTLAVEVLEESRRDATVTIDDERPRERRSHHRWRCPEHRDVACDICGHGRVLSVGPQPLLRDRVANAERVDDRGAVVSQQR